MVQGCHGEGGLPRPQVAEPGPEGQSSRLADSLAGDEVTVLRNVQAEEEQLPGRNNEKGDQTVEVLSGTFKFPSNLNT